MHPKFAKEIATTGKVSILFLLLSLSSFSKAFAAEVSTPAGTKIQRIDLYTGATTVAGDIAITTSPAGPCEGYALLGTDAANKQLLAIATAAQIADKPVVIYADNSKPWRGSSSLTCTITTISLRK